MATRETNEPAIHLQMRLYHVAIDARLHDLRGPGPELAALHHPDSYAASREVGVSLRAAGSAGVARSGLPGLLAPIRPRMRWTETKLLALVAEHTGNLVIITDRERRLVWANEAFTRLTGYELHEVLGRSPGELLQSELTDRATLSGLAQLVDRCGERLQLVLVGRAGTGAEGDAGAAQGNFSIFRVYDFMSVREIGRAHV